MIPSTLQALAEDDPAPTRDSLQTAAGAESVNTLKILIDHRLEALSAPSGEPRPRLPWRCAKPPGPGQAHAALLVLLTARQCGGDPAAALDTACALELIHAASLVLDDLPCMDDATLRRGRLATHRVHGEDIAILASVGMLNLAFSSVARCTRLPDPTRAKVLRALTGAVGTDGLIAGQELDLHEKGEGGGLHGALDCNHLKAGVLFEAAVACGAAIAQVDAASERALGRFARSLGEAFQLRDDLLDLHGCASELGKDVRQDAGRATAAALLGPERAATAIERHLHQGCAALARRALRRGAARQLHPWRLSPRPCALGLAPAPARRD